MFSCSERGTAMHFTLFQAISGVLIFLTVVLHSYCTTIVLHAAIIATCYSRFLATLVHLPCCQVFVTNKDEMIFVDG